MDVATVFLMRSPCAYGRLNSAAHFAVSYHVNLENMYEPLIAVRARAAIALLFSSHPDGGTVCHDQSDLARSTPSAEIRALS